MSDTFLQAFQDVKRHPCDKGQVLISADEAPRGVYYIHRGYIKAYDISAEGAYQIMTIYGSDEIFPMHWALDDEYLRLFYETMGPAELSMLAKIDFKKSVEDDPALLRVALLAALKAFRLSQARIKNLELPTAKQRIAYRLIFLATYYGHKESNAIEIDAPISYKGLAESLNLTRETVNRIMRQFINAGQVLRMDHHVTLLKPEQIKIILGDESALNI